MFDELAEMLKAGTCLVVALLDSENNQEEWEAIEGLEEWVRSAMLKAGTCLVVALLDSENNQEEWEAIEGLEEWVRSATELRLSTMPSNLMQMNGFKVLQ